MRPLPLYAAIWLFVASTDTFKLADSASTLFEHVVEFCGQVRFFSETEAGGFRLSFAAVDDYKVEVAVEFCLRISALVDLVLDDCRLEFIVCR